MRMALTGKIRQVFQGQGKGGILGCPVAHGGDQGLVGLLLFFILGQSELRLLVGGERGRVRERRGGGGLGRSLALLVLGARRSRIIVDHEANPLSGGAGGMAMRGRSGLAAWGLLGGPALGHDDVGSRL